MTKDNYKPRIIDGLLREIVEGLPAVMVVGPRACGKTTTAKTLAQSVSKLDVPESAQFFKHDPDSALQGLAEPALLDEWQEVPDVLGAVKRSVDDDAHPGRYILTGSVNARLKSHTWPGTGRLINVLATPMAERELRGDPAKLTLIDRIAEHGAEALELPSEQMNLRDYIEAAVRGGFPEPAIRYEGRARSLWYEGYLDQLYTRDAEHLEERRDPERVKRFFHAVALQSASTVQRAKLAQAAELSRNAAAAYDRLLQNLFIVDAIPAWAQRRLKRLTRAPKRVLCDAGLVSAALGLGAEQILREGVMIGSVLETFVAAQWRADLAASETRPRMYHLRQEQGRHEVDLIFELQGERIIAVEVKADAAPTSSAAVHLAWLRDLIGDKFVAGFVMHTGRHVYPMGDKIFAAPISVLWG